MVLHGEDETGSEHIFYGRVCKAALYLPCDNHTLHLILLILLGITSSTLYELLLDVNVFQP